MRYLKRRAQQHFIMDLGDKDILSQTNCVDLEDKDILSQTSSVDPLDKDPDLNENFRKDESAGSGPEKRRKKCVVNLDCHRYTIGKLDVCLCSSLYCTAQCQSCYDVGNHFFFCLLSQNSATKKLVLFIDLS